MGEVQAVVKSNPWMYQGKPMLSLDDVPVKGAIGFIYLIRQVSTGKKYIGKKLLDKAATKQVKGVKKKIRKESDWLGYFSSSPTILALIEEAGNTNDFTREILVFCKTKGSTAYLEELALYQIGALESDDFLNANIRSKVYKSWIAKDLDAAKTLRITLNQITQSASSSKSIDSSTGSGSLQKGQTAT